MTTSFVPLLLIGVLTSSGVYLLLERNLTRMLLGLLLVGNAINLLILTVGGPSGNPPIHGRTGAGRTTDADPLVQGMILTAIVISMGIAAFVLALAYRSYRLTTAEEVPDDPEDARVSQQIQDEADEDVVRPEPQRDEDEPAELDELPLPSRTESQRT
jgi:multicomponent Na+:H+ antiporter subunit C